MAGWEFFDHSVYNTRYTYGLPEEQERQMILDSMDTIEPHTGRRVAPPRPDASRLL